MTKNKSRKTQSAVKSPWFGPDKLRKEMSVVDHQEFLAELQCEPPSTTADELVLYELASEYHRRCDEYDVALCKNPEGKPRNRSELSQVNRHARQVKAELLQSVEERLGHVEKELDEAIRQYRKEYHDRRD